MSRLFKNPWAHDVHGIVDILRWKLRWGHHESAELPDAPDLPANRRVISSKEIATPPLAGWRLTWLGHASFLLQGGGVSILVDPVFSEFCAPLHLSTLRRKVATPCTIPDLPKIDLIMLTHGHYDHLDLPTLRQIGRKTRIIIAEGHADWLSRKGFENVSELAWHQCAEIFPGIRVTATPAQHFTARSLLDRDRGHWCGWLVEGAGCKLWYAGDTGYCPAFNEIGTRYGPIDFGMIPIGAYLPQRIMRAMHMNPQEAVRAFLDAKCRRAVAMHWGTFQLTDEPLGEPPLLLKDALLTYALPLDRFVAGSVGDQWRVIPEKSEFTG